MHVHCMYMYVCLSLLKCNYNLTNKSHTNLPEQHISKALANELCGRLEDYGGHTCKRVVSSTQAGLVR